MATVATSDNFQQVRIVFSAWSTQLEERLRTVISDTAKVAEYEAKRRVPVDRGTLRASIHTAFSDNGMAVVVGPPESMQAIVMEKGRRAGSRMPPVNVIELWALRHGYPRGMGFVIARSIARKGIKGRGYMEQARVVAYQRLEQLLDEMLRDSK